MANRIAIIPMMFIEFKPFDKTSITNTIERQKFIPLFVTLQHPSEKKQPVNF